MGRFSFSALFVLLLVQVLRVSSDFDPGYILRSLGLKNQPNVAKMNVSQEEYHRGMMEYLAASSKPGILQRLRPIRAYGGELEFVGDFKNAETLTLKTLFDGRMAVFQKIASEWKLVHEQELGFNGHPQWADAVLHPTTEKRIVLKVYLTCGREVCRLIDPVLNVLIRPGRSRVKRDNHLKPGTTACHNHYNRRDGKNKERCCRHKLELAFNKIPGYQFIIQPRTLDVGFCRGKCPFKYATASQHAFLQSVIKRSNRSSGLPRPCCAPAKFAPLEMLYVNETNQLSVFKWDDFVVTDCLCS